jgi:hypothetical protein
MLLGLRFFLRGNGGRGSPPEINFIDLGPVDPSWFKNYTFYNGPSTRARLWL